MHLLKISVSLYPIDLEINNKCKNETCLVIIPAIDNCDRVKMGQLISHEWCIFLQNQFQCFKVECLMMMMMMMMMMMNCFVVWLTYERRLALFPAGTIVRDPHLHKSLTYCEQGLNLHRT